MLPISPGLSSSGGSALTHACEAGEQCAFRATFNPLLHMFTHRVASCKTDLLQPGFLIHDRTSQSALRGAHANAQVIYVRIKQNR